jgi:hypothetical protein
MGGKIGMTHGVAIVTTPAANANIAVGSVNVLIYQSLIFSVFNLV